MQNTTYKLFEQVKSQIDPGTLFVEIGSERGGGSTYYLADLARRTNNDFITVDIDPIFLGSAIQTATMSGEQFVQQRLPSMGKQVGLVYMDGFDWTNEPAGVRAGTASADAYNLIEEYAKKNLTLNNISSVVTNLKQINGMLPFMAEKCVVILEKTWFLHALDIFVGKGSGAAVQLLASGFSLSSVSYKEQYVMLTRGMQVANLPNLDQTLLNQLYTGPRKRADAIIYKNID